MIAVFGAGAIGCYVGGMLAAGGQRVMLVGRERTARELAEGLVVVPMERLPRRVAPEDVPVATDPAALEAARTILVAVKSQDTAEAARTIAAHAAPDAQVVSLQNGLGNVEVLAGALGADRVVAGVVAFNVVRPSPAVFRQTTEGEIIVGTAAAELAAALNRAELEARTSDNMPGVQWSKLILNLNNAMNALSGMPLREQLLDHHWREVMAECAEEAIRVAGARGIRLERLGGVPPRAIPHVLRLPTPIFRIVAGALLRIDPEARTSMAQDLMAGKPSEIEWLNGAVAREGDRAGIPTPVNDAIIALTEQAFRAGRSPELDGAEARTALAAIMPPAAL